MSANDEFKDSNVVGTERPNQPDSVDNDYKSRTGQSTIPVVGDGSADAGGYTDSKTADSDAQLQKDEKDAIDSSNIIDSRTRGATKKAGTYQEPGDTEGLPENDGTSAVSGGPI
ncbi:hypothetical protein LTS08_000130 [Lithohypha guttulata]|uniref:Histone chaperone domain-containing protein n=1 Tax=Lithohypha guttulata TaxID=1690604 RepID=A0AAN7YFD4_9EURO|nr:hypothetical protein LTR51_007245 [Lithohypha guttulata]KAK5084435.1 hypothetical protein LTR05_005511 [Lithohypha guttulata]KAK5106014.1 hypothetical protein LTS08_000130 [Lithohypha guttulata]